MFKFTKQLHNTTQSTVSTPYTETYGRLHLEQSRAIQNESSYLEFKDQTPKARVSVQSQLRIILDNL